jgi:3-deoxy-D-manno-octulosonic-acid transferase
MNKNDRGTAGPEPFRWDFHPVRLLYTGLYGGAMLAYHTLHNLRGRISNNAFNERLGKPYIKCETPPIWVHASSMGEVRIAAGLMKKLAELSPSTGFICTVSTATGYWLARDMLGPRIVVVRAPIDLPRAMKSFIEQANPTALILIETEWWPNQLVECHRRGVRVFVANGRVSAGSIKRYRLVRRHLRPLLGRIERLYMRSPADAERVLSLGVSPARVEVAGSLKNIADPAGLVERTALPPGPPVFLAGCTRPGEEEIILRAYHAAKKSINGLRLWLAPRHPERFGEVAGILRKSGHSWAAYSVLPQNKLHAEDSPEIILIDKMGVLAGLYAHATVAFIGGSLLPFGGHNPVEPVLGGAPVLFGPFTEDQAEAARALENAGLGTRVTDARTLATGIIAAISDPPPYDEWNRRRREFFAGFDEAARYVAMDILHRLAIQ